MADDTRDIKSEAVDTALSGMKIRDRESPDGSKGAIVNDYYEHLRSSDHIKRSRSSTPVSKKSASHSPVKKDSHSHRHSQTPKSEDEDHEIFGGDITITVEPGKAPRLSRKHSEKLVARSPPSFDELTDVTEDALQVFQCIKECIYGSKYMGYSEHDVLDCDCSEEWSDGKNHACGEDSDCINRATKMECVDNECNCGIACQNQRFQRKQYANVSVIKTEKKGFGLRADADLNPEDFVFEYIGEVINEPTFRRRTIQYDEEGIKHFYFMSLTKSEFVDATKKGNLGRFCNHSCNPNCYVDKWVVGDKLRMGIFAERHIKAGEELVFNYNVDRYGADPQPCYCGEHNCTGFIGGKTQTERATKLSHATIEALGIDDGDGWDTAVAKKPRKKKTGEDDEEYVNNLQPKGLDENGVRKVMATLMQCKEKWIAVKLLNRLQNCEDDKVRNRVVQMHGYQILRTSLSTWKDDNNVILQILDILYKFPRLTRNKISDSKIEAAIETLVTSEHEDVAFESGRLLEEWSKLEVAYRIPRKKFDPNAVPIFERRDPAPAAQTTAPSPVPAIVAPSGPKSNIPQRSVPFFSPRPPVRRNLNVLPPGWFTAKDEKGNPYYYSKAGQTTWHRPFLPAAEPPPPPKLPPKAVQNQKALQDIIDSITKAEPVARTPIRTASGTPRDEEVKIGEKKKPVEKWRSLSEEKQKKIYENTLFPHIKHVMQKFTKQLPREDLKKFAKEVAKKLVNSDFTHKRVEDPTKITEKQEKKVKSYVRQFFEKAVEKKKIIDAKAAEKARLKAVNGGGSSSQVNVNGNGNGHAHHPRPHINGKTEHTQDTHDDFIELTPNSSPTESPFAPAAPHSPIPGSSNTPIDSSFSDLKRKRSPDDDIDTPNDDSESNKRLKEEEVDIEPPPPPPPPPSGEMPMVDGVEEESEEQKELRKQEEELMKENEEAMKMDLDGSLKSAEEKLQAEIARSMEMEVDKGVEAR